MDRRTLFILLYICSFLFLIFLNTLKCIGSIGMLPFLLTGCPVMAGMGVLIVRILPVPESIGAGRIYASAWPFLVTALACGGPVGTLWAGSLIASCLLGA